MAACPPRTPKTTSLVAVVALFVAVLGAVPVEGRWCGVGDVFKNGNDYTTASIPSDCTTLGLYNKKIGATGATALAEALKGNTALATLYLDSNNIGDSGATAIAAALKGNTALTTLDLQSNNIGDSGATALAEALKGNAALTTLNLYKNNIGDRGATTLAEALKGNAALTDLVLESNNIGATGATAFAEALKGNAALTTLSLYGNNIGDTGATALAEALKANAALTTLSLSSNNIGDSGATALAAALKGNAALTTLYLVSNNINDRTLTKAIAASVAENYNPTTRAAKIKAIKSAALTANPCGAYKGCAKVLGGFILAQFVELDLPGLHDFGIRSAMELLGLALGHRLHSEGEGSTEPTVNLSPTQWSEPGSPEKVAYHALERFAKPLKLIKRKKFMEQLKAKVAGVDADGKGSEATDAFLSLFGLHKAAVEAAAVLPFGEWKAAMHLPAPFSTHLRNAGIHDVWDLAALSAEEARRTVASKDLHTKLNLVEAAYVHLLFQHHGLLKGGRLAQLLQAHLDEAYGTIDGAAAVQLPFSEWAAAMAVPDVCVARLEGLGVSMLPDLEFLAKDDIFADTFVSTLKAVDVATCNAAIATTFAALEKQGRQTFRESVQEGMAEAVRLPVNEWATATTFPAACTARLKELGMLELSDFELLPDDAIFTEHFVKRAKVVDLAKCRIAVEETRPALEAHLQQERQTLQDMPEEKVMDALRLPLEAWAAALALPTVCRARLKGLGILEISDFEYSSADKILAATFTSTLKSSDLAKCKLAIEKTFSALEKQKNQGTSEDAVLRAIQLPFNEWAAAMALPDACATHLKTLKIDAISDFEFVSNDKILTATFTKTTKVVDLAKCTLAIEKTRAALDVHVRQETQKYAEMPEADVMVAIKLPANEWEAAMALPEVCIARLKELRLDGLSGFEVLDDATIFTRQFVKTLKRLDSAKCTLAIEKTRAALDVHVRQETQKHQELVQNAASGAIQMPFNEWAAAMALPEVCIARLKDLGLEDDLSDFRLLSLAEMFTDDFVGSLKRLELAKCRITIEKTRSALGYGDQGAEGSSHDGSDL